MSKGAAILAVGAVLILGLGTPALAGNDRRDVRPTCAEVLAQPWLWPAWLVKACEERDREGASGNPGNPGNPPAPAPDPPPGNGCPGHGGGKPGYGKGDKNHQHDGPPGRNR